MLDVRHRGIVNDVEQHLYHLAFKTGFVQVTTGPFSDNKPLELLHML